MVLFVFCPDKRNSVLSDLRSCEVYSFTPAYPGAQTDFNDQCEQGTLAVAVVQKLSNLFMREPGHLLFCDGEFAHFLQRVRRCPFT